ncbi:MAG TPA: hypothetical protein VFX78_04280 [Candidatus Eisenbacteria bacterium]|jgi:Tol biopolymer transport system component|nr:hypothetical protein [Candidatus Eisenbacteria bacterium]
MKPRQCISIALISATVASLLLLCGCGDDSAVTPTTPGMHRLAFMSRRSGLPQIYVMNSDGSGVERISSTEAAIEPTWAPGGAWVAFAGGDSLLGDVQIFVVSPRGTNQVNLTKAPGTVNVDPSWSPDGSKIAFMSTRDGNAEIYVMNSDGSGLHRLTKNSSADSRARWVPGGDAISFLSNRDGKYEIYVMSPDGSHQVAVTDPPHDVFDYAWSSDRRLAFSSLRAGNADIYATVWITAGEIQLTSDSLNQSDPAWSPDGGRIAYMSFDGMHVAASDGSTDQWVPNSNYLGFGLAWSPDGRSIVLANLDNGDFDIVITAPDGTERRNLTQSPGDDTEPAWEP